MKWIKLTDKKPTAYQSGAWDGLKSDSILILCGDGTMHIGYLYKIPSDFWGEDKYEFYDDRGYYIHNPTHWAEIEPAPDTKEYSIELMIKTIVEETRAAVSNYVKDCIDSQTESIDRDLEELKTEFIKKFNKK